MRNGILAGGNLIVDYIKIVDYYPNKNMMCNILKEVIVAVGGGPHNTLVTLSKLDVGLNLSVMGLVGNDNGADLIIKDFEDNNINTTMIKKINDKNTSFTDVIIDIGTGERTFMHYAGANAVLDFFDFESVKNSNAKIFYLGNLLHLDKLDCEDDEYGLISAKVLNFLTNCGFKTAADTVSVKSPLFEKVYKHCLKHLDYLIINEIEAQSLTNKIIRDEKGNLIMENLEMNGELLINAGVRQLVVIHFPEGGYARNIDGNTMFVESFKVNKEDIKSTVGCGDAFNAGVLYSIHENLSMREALIMGNACARYCLFDNTTTGGATNLNNIKNFIKEYNNK